MNTKNKLNKFDSKLASEIRGKLKKADAVVIGAGAGLSASAGLNYTSEAFFADNYAPFLKKGYKTISEGISANWYLNEASAKTYWGFWANHINNVFYRPGQLATYRALHEAIKDKTHFIITTNADGQFFKGCFDADKIFAMQGSYGNFQCQKKCHMTLYDNKKIIGQMLDGFDLDSLEIREEDIPRCPVCGELMAPNLRIDSYFVEGENMRNKDRYIDFLNRHIDQSIVFLELGVGYNTPVIIRSPFEEMAAAFQDGYLIRVNKFYPDLPAKLTGKGIGLAVDVDSFIGKIL